MDEDSSRVTMHRVITFYSSPGVLAGIGVLWHSSNDGVLARVSVLWHSQTMVFLLLSVWCDSPNHGVLARVSVV